MISRSISLAAIAWISIGQAAADPATDSLRIYAVHVLQDTASKARTGYGIYLGAGLIITAAHVVSSKHPAVSIGGRDLPAAVLGQSDFEALDLALLSVDQELLPVSQRLRRLSLCRQPLRPGRSVVVAIPEGVANSQIMSPLLLPANLRERFPTLIPDVATTGNSGSGVFDAELKCLAGIMSRKIIDRPPSGSTAKPRDIAKYFVPAPTIAMFIADTVSLVGVANPYRPTTPENSH